VRPVVRDLPDAARALEATLLRQLLASSGVFRGSGAAGSGLSGEMFLDALADAVAKAGGLGIAPLLVRTLEGETGRADDLMRGVATAGAQPSRGGEAALALKTYGVRADNTSKVPGRDPVQDQGRYK